MSASWKIASMMMLPLSLALAGVGCVAQAEDPADSEVASVDEGASVDEAAGEMMGEAAQACGFGYGGYGGPFFGAPYGGGYFGRRFYGSGCGFPPPYFGGGCGYY